MGVIVTQEPTSINVTGTDLIYSVSSSLASSPQFRYVTDIYESGSNNFITTLKTYPNLYGTANINVARELSDQDGYNNTWKITQGEVNAEVKDFLMYFGEEYSTSISSSRVIYTGSIAYDLEVFPGGVQVNEGRNFPSASFNPTLYSAVTDESRLGALLSNNPSAQNSYDNTVSADPRFRKSSIALPIGINDYGTLSVLKNPGWVSSTIGQISMYDSTGAFMASYYNIPIPIELQTLESSGIIDIPAGPFNFYSVPSIWSQFQGDWSCYSIRLATQSPVSDVVTQWYVNPLNPSGLEILAAAQDDFRESVLSMIPQNPCQDYTRFAWTNQYGMWDYYNVYNPVRRNTNVKRNIYSRPNTRYEDCYAGYDVTNRGERQYMTEYTDTYSITTDYIDKFNSQWLTEMFLSNDVFIQNGNQFEPIIITNRSIDWNMNQNRQKLFQYEIEYNTANQRETR
tara:strand:+ start:3312 stop:4676 length:1365 start_codon:yes stop_codon:yes gene_type:complete